jgi:hypothetical protein
MTETSLNVAPLAPVRPPEKAGKEPKAPAVVGTHKPLRRLPKLRLGRRSGP